MADTGVDAVAVCYLHAYRNDAHEAATGQAVTHALQGGVRIAVVAMSCRRVQKEYEQFGTTVVNAFVGPIASPRIFLRLGAASV